MVSFGMVESWVEGEFGTVVSNPLTVHSTPATSCMHISSTCPLEFWDLALICSNTRCERELEVLGKYRSRGVQAVPPLHRSF
eukprot:1136338-Pelagomonas_calceolata.AAC.6